MREIYRLHKSEFLYSFLEYKSILLGITYVGKEISEYHYMEKKMLSAFEKLKNSYLASWLFVSSDWPLDVFFYYRYEFISTSYLHY